MTCFSLHRDPARVRCQDAHWRLPWGGCEIFVLASSHGSVAVLQVQTLYYSADHKLLDGNPLDGQAEVFGSDDDHIQFVQVHIAQSEVTSG